MSNMTSKREELSTFPFNHVKLKEVKQFADIIEKVFLVQSILGGTYSQRTEAIILQCLRFINESLQYPLKGKSFVDLMSNSPIEAAIFAACFGFGEVESCELTDENYYKAVDLKSRFPSKRVGFCSIPTSDSTEVGFKMHIKRGSFQDYFTVDGDIYYLDCSVVTKSMMDECPVIAVFLRMFSNCLPGTFCIIVTTSSTICARPNDEFGIENVIFQFSTRVGEGTREDCTAWVLKAI